MIERGMSKLLTLGLFPELICPEPEIHHAPRDPCAIRLNFDFFFRCIVNHSCQKSGLLHGR